MNEGTVTQGRTRRVGKDCRHHWLIETPHGVMSQGRCKRCGANKRFPNATEDILLAKGRPPMGRWARNRGRSAENGRAGGAKEGDVPR